MIDSKTSFLALIGNPVEHSLSPIMQNAAIKFLGLNLVYFAIPCKNDDFQIVIDGLKKINCKGLNITIPFKEKAFNLCEEISPIAKKVKAINTLKINHNETWSGTNTDVDGFKYPIKDINLSGKKSIILGSGGAARSAVQGLIDLQLSDIHVISRNESNLKKFLKDFKNFKSVRGCQADNRKTDDLINDSDLIINTTPIGMKNFNSNEEELPFGKNFWRSLNSKTIVYDLIYNPRFTELLKISEKKGCQIIDGSEMLVAQGAKSLSYWTDIKDIPTEIMKKAINKYL
tara:strand:- start:326 stop:1186 length:861 start_codon:yes stop_codon:yes gene_type:complete